MTRFRRLRTYGPMRSEILHGSADTFSLIWRVQRHLQVWLNMLSVVTPNRFRIGSACHWILTRGLRHIPIPLHNSVRSSQSHSKLHPIDIQVSFSNGWCNTRIVPVKVVVVSLLQSHWTSVVTTVVTVLKLYSKLHTYSIQVGYSCITSQCSKDWWFPATSRTPLKAPREGFRRHEKRVLSRFCQVFIAHPMLRKEAERAVNSNSTFQW